VSIKGVGMHTQVMLNIELGSIPQHSDCPSRWFELSSQTSP